MTVRRSRLVRSIALVPLLVGALAACSSDDSASTTTTAGDGHDHGYGSSMEPPTFSVADVADLGPGPKVGDRWSGLLGLNVCGRFLEPPHAVPTPKAGFTTAGDGTFELAPEVEEDAGHGATVGDLAELAGIRMATGELHFPDTTEPPVVDLGPAGEDFSDVQVAGAVLRTGDACGDSARGEVQLWVFDRAAVDTGEVVRVVTDPQDVPVVEDGMAFVIAFSPESSLPTLPPSALIDRG